MDDDDEWDINWCNLCRIIDRCVTIQREDKAKGCCHTKDDDDDDDLAEEEDKEMQKTTSQHSKLDGVLIRTGAVPAVGLVGRCMELVVLVPL